MENRTVAQFNEVKYREFPHVLFGQSGEGIIYFDATVCVGKGKSEGNRSVPDFSEKFGWWIHILSEAYGVPTGKMIVENGDGGNLLMEESLFLPFIAYLDAAFAVYMLERISEMLVTGIVLSDSALLVHQPVRRSCPAECGKEGERGGREAL